MGTLSEMLNSSDYETNKKLLEETHNVLDKNIREDLQRIIKQKEVLVSMLTESLKDFDKKEELIKRLNDEFLLYSSLLTILHGSKGNTAVKDIIQTVISMWMDNPQYVQSFCNIIHRENIFDKILQEVNGVDNVYPQ